MQTDGNMQKRMTAVYSAINSANISEWKKKYWVFGKLVNESELFYFFCTRLFSIGKMARLSEGFTKITGLFSSLH